MEEDIKVLENIINELKGETHYLLYTNKEKVQAIENLIVRNKELKYWYDFYKEQLTFDSIPKSKVREKIEEINDEELNFNEDDYWIEQEMKGYAIDHIQELLREGDK